MGQSRLRENGFRIEQSRNNEQYDCRCWEDRQMTEELLIELDEAKGLDTAFGGLEGLRRLFVQQAASVLGIVSQFPAQVRHRWEQFCVAVGAGHLEKVHQLRPEFERLVESRLQHLKHAQELASMAAVLGGEELPGSGELPRLIADLERFCERVLGGWTSTEALEELAVADYPLPARRLKELCQKYPPAPSWYEEDSKPF
jgi:hypothetical protein